MAELEQTAQTLMQMGPVAHLKWWLPKLDADLNFAGRSGTQMPAFPGEPDRRCDTVMELESEAGTQPPVALIAEIEARPRGGFADRLLEYLARCRRKIRLEYKRRNGGKRRDPVDVLALVVVLTGRMRPIKIRSRLKGTSLRMTFGAVAFNLASKDVSKFLSRIESGELGRALLPWAALMRGANDPEVAKRWVALAQLETDEQKRRDYGELLRVFADRAGCLDVWNNALGDWQMWKSQVIEGRRQEGRVETTRAHLLKLLRKRFPEQSLPKEVETQIEQTTDLARLESWFDSAFSVASLEAFQALVQSPSNGTQTN